MEKKLLVEIRPIEKNQWHGKKGAESITKAKTIEALYDNRSGGYATGLTEEEANELSNKAIEVPFTSDVGGMFARQFRDLYPWFSPANKKVSTVNDIITPRYNTSNAEQDELYDNKINFINLSEKSELRKYIPTEDI